VPRLEPDIEPKNAEAKTDTFAPPPLSLPANFVEIDIKAFPPSPIPTKAPKITNTATTLTDTPVKFPYIPALSYD